MKRLLKSAVDGLCSLLILPVALLFFALSIPRRRDGVFWSFSQFLSLLPGKTGCYLRKSFYRLSMTRCASDCQILFGALFSQVDTEIGSRVYIGPNCNIGRCRLEEDCTLGSNVHIMSGKRQHRFGDIDKPVREQGGVYEKITIGRDTWIGNGALVMANVGKKCIVGAGSVVTKEVADFSVVAGNPARVIRTRKQVNDG